MTRVGMMTEMSCEVDEEVNRDENGEADGMIERSVEDFLTA